MMGVVLLAGVGLGFLLTNQQNQAYAYTTSGVCYWRTSGKIQCKYDNLLTSAMNGLASFIDSVTLTPTDVPVIGGAFAAFDPVAWDQKLTDVATSSCLVSSCDDYWYAPGKSKEAGYPIFNGGTGNHAKYLHFVSLNPLFAYASNDGGKIASIPCKSGDSYDKNCPDDIARNWIPIGNIQDALDSEDLGQCSLKYTGPCKPQDTEYYKGEGLDTNQFRANIRSIIALIALRNQCEKEAPLAFITCPIYEGVVGGISKLIGGQGVSGERQGLLIDFLTISPLSTKDGKSVFQQIVGNMVAAVNIFYVLIFIILIFSSSLPFGLDNYTIKKTLPKFIGAVIMTQFSYLICGVIIDFFNLLGTIVPNFVFALGAVNNPTATGNSISGGLTTAIVLGGGGAVAIIATVGWIIIILLAIIALIAMLVAFVYMMLRYLIMYILILLAPLAFASWVLPGTEKFFKSWWKNFIRLNAMFPLITGMLAVSILLSRVLISNPAKGNTGGVLKLVGMVIPIAALLAIPRTLKWTSDGMNFLAGKLLGGAAGKMPGGGKALGGKTAKATAQKGIDYGKKQSVDFGKRKAAEMGLGTQSFQRRQSQIAAEQARGKTKEVIANLNQKDLRTSATTAAGAAAASPKNARASGTFKAHMDRLIETGDSLGLARVQQQYYRSASAAGLTDSEINDNWANALGSNYGAAKEMSPTFGKASNATMINASATSSVDITAAGGHGMGDEYVHMNGGDFKGMGEDKLRSMDTDMVKSILTSVANGANMGAFEFDQASVEKALTEPGSTFKSAETRKALQTIAATKGWRYQ